MKRTCTSLLIIPFLIISLSFSPVTAQQQKAPQQQENQVSNEKLNQLKLQLLDLEKDHVKKKSTADEAIKKAETLSGEISEATSQLAKSPDDKKIASELKKLERESKRADRSARKAGEELIETETRITELQKEIEGETARLSAIGGSQASTSNYGLENERSSGQPISSTDQSQSDNDQDATKNASQQAGQGRPEMVQKIVEDTYKNYPQQGGQPNIIINNIIVPSEHAPAAAATSSHHGLTPEEIAEFRAWRRQAYEPYNQGRKGYSRYEHPQYAGGEPHHGYQQDDRFAFRDRFAELPKRKSGLWVIPMVGLHASNFEMDFDNNEAKGRSGWNAGIDFRAHFNRFFIQPGAHYFSSSMDLSTSDSLSTTPFTSGPRIHSVRVPVLAGVYLTKAQGAFFKFNLKGGIVGNYIVDVDKNDQNFTIDNLERYSYGLNGGFGMEFGFLTIDLSHEWGISKFFKNSDSKNNMLRATIGFKL